MAERTQKQKQAPSRTDENVAEDVKVTNEYFDVGRKVAAKEVFTNQFVKR